MVSHFIVDTDLTPQQQNEVLDRAEQMKRNRYGYRPFAGPQTVAVFFDKTSTRTRISFSVGIAELGGNALIIDSQQSQLGHKESIEDTASVLERMVSQIIWRTYSQENLERMAGTSHVPVINALSDKYHPCQVLADLQTIREYKGSTQGLTLAYIGDGNNNMAHSYLLGGVTAGMNIRIGAPQTRFPSDDVLKAAHERAHGTNASITIETDPYQAVKNADVIATDTWLSMGDQTSEEELSALFSPYSVNDALVNHAKNDAIILHCLPAYRGYEISADVIDTSVSQGGHSVVWDEAENRLHTQKALMDYLAEQNRR